MQECQTPLRSCRWSCYTCPNPQEIISRLCPRAAPSGGVLKLFPLCFDMYNNATPPSEGGMYHYYDITWTKIV